MQRKIDGGVVALKEFTQDKLFQLTNSQTRTVNVSLRICPIYPTHIKY